jgi:N-carbamoylputrescine amidase
LALKGAEIIFYPTAIGRPATGHEELAKAEHEAWQTIQRSHAIANGVFVAAVNRVGVEDHLNFWGTSFVADPLGRILQQASQDQEEVLVVECDLSLIKEVRSDWPFLKCRRSDVY